MVVLIGGAVVVWALFADEPAEVEPVEQRATLTLQQLTARPLVLFEPMVWTAGLKRLPLDELVEKLEQELRERRREAAEYATELQVRRPDPS
jgi:hypothetical protein